MLVGNKNRFAIEFEITNHYGDWNDGKIALFINNLQIGYFGDIDYLSFLYDAIDRVLKSNDILFPEFKNKKASEVMKLFNVSKNLNSGDDKYHGSLIQAGEAFDDFLFLAYKTDSETIWFLWKLLKKPFFKYNFTDYTSKHFELDISEVKLVIDEYKENVLNQNPKKIS